MGNFFARAFFCLWPNQSKHYFTDEGRRMRYAMAAVTGLHGFMFVLSLCLVGFYPMLYNLLLAAWAYSCYLTLREREIVFYFILVVVASVLELMRLFDENKEGSWQSLGGMAELGLYCLALYISGRYYYVFRISGGLHGISENSKQARRYRSSIKELNLKTPTSEAGESLINQKLAQQV